ncbi:MAG: ABC transporter ATP-binding protein [Chloroflexota bacterium]
MLETKGITKDFSGLRAVDDLSLVLEPGEILGLIGPNGSGKSTSINVITGLLKPTDGQVMVDGSIITAQPPHKIARAGLARTFQTIKLFTELTVLENVEVGAVSAGMNRRAARQQAEAILAELEIDHLGHLEAGTLPYGDERRVEIARALARGPQYLLLDEPAAGLNERESDTLLDTLAIIPEKYGCGILIVDHDMRLIMRLCHRLHVLNHGKTIATGSPQQVRENPAVIEAYLGREGSADAAA